MPPAKIELSERNEALGRWMVEYQAGQTSAFERLYDSLKPSLHAYLAALCLNSALADDLFQECFLQIHRSRHTYQPGRPVKPWVFGIARYVFRSHRKSSVRRARREQDRASTELVFDSSFDRIAEREQIVRGLRHVAPKRREALVLRHAFGWSYDEIAQLLGVRAGTARVRAHRGMEDIRHHLEDSRGGES